MTDYIDPTFLADRLADEVDRTGYATAEALLESHAAAVAAELNARGYQATAVGKLVNVLAR